MATSPVASTLPPGYSVEQPTVATLKTTDAPATHVLGPSGIMPTLPPGYSIEGQQPPAPVQTAEQTLSDHNRYMVSAMTGQGKDFSQDPTLSPEERQQAEAGRKAGTIQGGVDIGLGAALGPALEFLGMGGKVAAKAAPEVKQVGTGLLDQFGSEIFKDVPVEAKQAAWKLLQDPKVQVALKSAAKGTIKATGGAGLGLIAQHVLHWLLTD